MTTLTRADLEQLPDDGRRYELLDGALLVTPAPSHAHQRVSLNLTLRLHAACPDHLEVLYAPFDVALAHDTILQPDLLAARREDLTDRDLPVPPVLAVEIASPRSRSTDLTRKKQRYERAGCASYWVVDPFGPRLLAWDLIGGRYVQVADVVGEESWTATAPYAVTIRPIDLLR